MFSVAASVILIAPARGPVEFSARDCKNPAWRRLGFRVSPAKLWHLQLVNKQHKQHKKPVEEEHLQRAALFVSSIPSYDSIQPEEIIRNCWNWIDLKMSEATGAADRGHVQHADSRFHTMTCWNWRGLLCMCGFTCCMYALLRLVRTIKTIYSAFLLKLILEALRDHVACFIISETLIMSRYVV